MHHIHRAKPHKGTAYSAYSAHANICCFPFSKFNRIASTEKCGLAFGAVASRSWHHRRDSQEPRASRHRCAAGLGLRSICRADETGEVS
jgi:hypothetical protein